MVVFIEIIRVVANVRSTRPASSAHCCLTDERLQNATGDRVNESANKGQKLELRKSPLRGWRPENTQCTVSKQGECSCHTNSRYATMRHVPEAELLDAMKEQLRDLEKIRLLSPIDLEMLSLRRNLQKRIALLESQLLQDGKPANPAEGTMGK